MAQQGVGAPFSLLVREGNAIGIRMSVITLTDRRPGAPTQSVEWTFQRQVETALYNHGYASSTGAVYRLLQRSGVGHHTLPLKKASISAGLVTQQEWDWLYQHLVDVRSFTLIPLTAMRTAIETFGRDTRSEALVRALGIEKPDSWEEEGVEEEEEEGGEDEDDEDEEGEEEEDEEEDEDEDDEDEEEMEGDDMADAASDSDSVAGTEVVGREPPPVNSHAGGDEAALGGGAPGPSDSTVAASTVAKKQRSAAFEVSPKLEAELAAFDAHRAAPLNQSRKGTAVAPATRESDRGHIIRFLGWVNTAYELKAPPTLGVFGHANIASAAERYIKHLVEERGRAYSYGAQIAASLIAVASFVDARKANASTGGVDIVSQLRALHSQCKQQARRHDKFDVDAKCDGWLDWDSVQRVRAEAERALEAAQSDAEKLSILRDVLVLRLLADQPPDRVGVTRQLRLGYTLKRKTDGAGYELDLSEPGCHKTSAVFGATKTTINASLTPWISKYIAQYAIPVGGYLFHARGNEFEPIAPSAWTKRVKAVFARHGDVALCPKDTRSSFITFLRSGEHDDETVKAAAVAMRHSSKMQASAAYDKGASDRRVSAAMKVASDFAAKF
jgi:hypothetical protein